VSDHWRATRTAALERAGGKCQLCSGAGPLNVHHNTYDRLGGEHPADVIVLCRDCHKKFHGKE
jgi:5-methylcytosine-specific restriction endonuclease McrA